MTQNRALAALFFFSLVLLSSTSFAQPVRAESAARVAQAEAAPPPTAAPAPADTAPPAPSPAPTPTPDAPATAMDGVHGEVSLGAVRYLGTTAGTLVGGRVTAQRWFDNFALLGGFHVETDGDDAVAAGVSFGARVLGSGTKSGPFAGAGIGVLHLTVNAPNTGTTPTSATEDKLGGVAYAEIGAIARGRWTVGARLDLPMFAVTDAKLDGVDRSGNVGYRPSTTRPIGIGLEVGFIF